MIKKAELLSLLLPLLLAFSFLVSYQPAVIYAYFNASIHPEVRAVAASLDMDFNGDQKSIVRFPIQANPAGQKILSIVTITNLGTIPAELCIEPSAKNPATIKILTARSCLAGFKPQDPTKFSLEWEILPNLTQDAGSNYEVSFQVTLKNGFLVTKELIFIGEFSQNTPTPTNTTVSTQTPTATPTPTPPNGKDGTSISAKVSALGFYELKEEQKDSKTPCDGKEMTNAECAILFTYGVRGEICVTNQGDQRTDTLAIFDQVQVKDKNGEYTRLENASLAVSVASELAPGEIRCFPYRIEFDPGEYKVFRNTVQVVILNHAGWIPKSKNCPGPAACPFGPTVKVDFTLSSKLSSTPTPTATVKPKALMATPAPTKAQARPTQVGPTATPAASATPTSSQPAASPTPTETTLPGKIFTPTATPLPTRTPLPTETRSPTKTPLPTATATKVVRLPTSVPTHTATPISSPTNSPTPKSAP